MGGESPAVEGNSQADGCGEKEPHGEFGFKRYVLCQASHGTSWQKAQNEKHPELEEVPAQG